MKLKDETPTNELNGVYRLECGECNEIYNTDETSRQINIRVMQ